MSTGSGSDMEAKNASYHGTNSGFVPTQCSPKPPPELGIQRIIYGNGTSVGTVIALRCPDKHKLIGDSLKCVLDHNGTHWEGDTYCMPLSYNEAHGFQLAMLISIISLGIIFFMSMAFITCCLLDCIDKGKRKEMERDSERPPQWEEQNHQQEMNRSQYNNKSRNNNNNNFMEKELTQWNHRDPGQGEYYHTCRCQQQYNYDPIVPYDSYEVAPRFPVLPEYEYNQSLLPQYPNSLNSYVQTTGSSRQTLSSDAKQVHTTSSDLVWQCEASQRGRLSGNNQPRSKNPKEFSIRVISV